MFGPYVFQMFYCFLIVTTDGGPAAKRVFLFCIVHMYFKCLSDFVLECVTADGEHATKHVVFCFKRMLFKCFQLRNMWEICGPYDFTCFQMCLNRFSKMCFHMCFQMV